MNLDTQTINNLKNYDKDEIFQTVGYFPECKIKNLYYPEGEIHLKYGFQNEKNIHNGFGILHIILGAHTKDEIYAEVNTPDDIANVLKQCLKKNSPIFMEHTNNFIVISTSHTKIVLNYIPQTRSYSVITCHSITNTYNKRKHGQSIGKIKKDLNNKA